MQETNIGMYCRLHARDQHWDVLILQFQRVLSELELAGLVSAQEFSILFTKFEIKVGGRLDINYITFCETCKDAKPVTKEH